MERGQRPAQHRGWSTYRSPQNVSVNWSFCLIAAQMPWKRKYDDLQPACLLSPSHGISPDKHCYVCLFRDSGVTGTASTPSPILSPTVTWVTEQKLPIDSVSSWVNITTTYIFRFFLLAFTFLGINLFLCHSFCAFKNMLGNIILTSKRFFLFSLCSFRGKIPSDSYILNANLLSFLQRLSKGFLSPLTAPQVIFFPLYFPLSLDTAFLLFWTPGMGHQDSPGNFLWGLCRPGA